MKLFKKLGDSFKKDMKMLGSGFKKPPHKAIKERFSKKPSSGGIGASPEVADKASKVKTAVQRGAMVAGAMRK